MPVSRSAVDMSLRFWPWRQPTRDNYSQAVISSAKKSRRLRRCIKNWYWSHEWVGHALLSGLISAKNICKAIIAFISKSLRWIISDIASWRHEDIISFILDYTSVPNTIKGTRLQCAWELELARIFCYGFRERINTKRRWWKRTVMASYQIKYS